MELGVDMPKDPAQALALGRSYEYGIGTKCDWKRSFAIYEALAAQNYGPGVYALAESYARCHGVRPDRERANALYLKAAGLGCADAMVALAGSFRYGLGVEENLHMAFGLYTAAAAAGSTEGMYSLGRCYLEGEGTPKDPAQGLCWMEKAARLGLPCAMYRLGVALDEAGDRTAAGQWIHEAAAWEDRFAVVAAALDLLEHTPAGEGLCPERVMQALADWAEDDPFCRRLLTDLRTQCRDRRS